MRHALTGHLFLNYMYLKCKWIQLFLLLCSLPLPSSWWGTDSFRTARVQRSHSRTNIALLWPQEAESLSHKSGPRHSSVAASGWEPPLPQVWHALRLRLGPGGWGSSFCPCPLSLLCFSPHFISPGTCLPSCASGSLCRSLLYLVLWPEVSVSLMEPLPKVGQTGSPSTSPERPLPHWCLCWVLPMLGHLPIIGLDGNLGDPLF